MGRSILHKPRAEKHLRLFELIRQGDVAEQQAARPPAPFSASAEQVQAFRAQAEYSLNA